LNTGGHREEGKEKDIKGPRRSRLLTKQCQELIWRREKGGRGSGGGYREEEAWTNKRSGPPEK